MPHGSGPQAAVWTGRLLSTLVVAALLLDGAVQLFAPGALVSMLQETGFASRLAPTLGAIMIGCAIVYVVRATAVLGAILVTGFLGGAICAHLRLGELGSPPELVCLLLGLMAWGGLYLRDPHLRAVLQLRS